MQKPHPAPHSSQPAVESHALPERVVLLILWANQHQVISEAMLERRTGLPVHMWDERLTTVAADRTLIEAGVRRENRKEYVDMLAAVYILQGYLDSLERKKNDEEN